MGLHVLTRPILTRNLSVVSGVGGWRGEGGGGRSLGCELCHWVYVAVGECKWKGSGGYIYGA